jgi:NAD(P)-dependent dehydrogenase (short-subunit alcohol dehydrogenase family)
VSSVSGIATVTGGSSGIGRAIVRLLRARGYVVIVLDKQNPGEELDLWLQVDVGVESHVEAAFSAIAKEHGELDVLVNCAGIDIGKPLVETTLEEWETVNRINATGVFLCTRAAARSMIRRQSGSIVSVSSGNAHLGWRNRAAYSASKGAIEAFTRAVAAELGRYGIRANAVAPGSTATPIWGDGLTDEARRVHGMRTALGYVAEPEEIAEVVAFLASEASRYVTGIVIPVDGGRATIDYLPPSET